jgi:hypothetical protein
MKLSAYWIATVGLFVGSSSVFAEGVSITNTNYVGGPPKSVKPQGTYAVGSQHARLWQIRTEIGYFTSTGSGNFTVLQPGAITSLTNIPTTGAGNWAQQSPTIVTNETWNALPAGLHLYVRANLEIYSDLPFTNWKIIVYTDMPFGEAKVGNDNPQLPGDGE